MAIITISRQLGSEGNAIANRLAENLGYSLIDKTKIHGMVTDYEQFKDELEKVINEEKPGLLDRFFQSQKVYFNLLQALIYEAASTGNVIITGRGGHLILKDIPGVLRVRIISPYKLRVRRVMENPNMTREAAEEFVRQNDRERTGFIRYLFDVDPMDPGIYDLVINTEHLNVSVAVNLIIDAVKFLESSGDTSGSLENLKKLALAKKVEVAISNVLSGSSYVEVQANIQGVITLEGVVRSEEEKRSIEKKVSSVPGVMAVMNHLDVRQVSPRDEWPYRVRF